MGGYIYVLPIIKGRSCDATVSLVLTLNAIYAFVLRVFNFNFCDLDFVYYD